MEGDWANHMFVKFKWTNQICFASLLVQEVTLTVTEKSLQCPYYVLLLMLKCRPLLINLPL